MAEVIFLGTGAALAGADRENSYLLVRGEQTTIMVDCAGAPAQRMTRIGLSLDVIDHLILTHHHPDHVYGYAMLVLNAWLQGRKRKLTVHGLAATVKSAQVLLEIAEANSWPNLFPLEYVVVAPKDNELILTTPDFTVSATMGDHFVPTMGIRISSERTGRTLTYTSDTAPSEKIIELARNADVLIHEATALNGNSPGHSTAVQAGAQARIAHAKELIMIHVPPDCDPKAWRRAAETEFDGPVRVANDFDRVEF